MPGTVTSTQAPKQASRTRALSVLHYRIICRAIAAVGDKKCIVLLESRVRSGEQDQHGCTKGADSRVYFCAL